MFLTEAVDAIREKLIDHRLPERKKLWTAMLKQITKHNWLDGNYANIIEETIMAHRNKSATGSIDLGSSFAWYFR